MAVLSKPKLTDKMLDVLRLLVAGNGRYSYRFLDDFSCEDEFHSERPLTCSCKSGYHAEQVPAEFVGLGGWPDGTKLLYYVHPRSLSALRKMNLVEWVNIQDGSPYGQITEAGRAKVSS